ncbi:hypothetical protein [Companilactobacillus ginsenosidimutans]|uniref:Gram-positive cocci surface proteins LPxTG domain-containing protein n=1 Tax=Companilactobacillus ginsenosidimutans TaxID=1007676 RepID=A0A0H4QKW5_9LACO|nr:hypothetical protein [Companilactobacillus ginsenosidimutans]AKP67741.1 hypothetical protein ABM34_09515 [Companilactobacillus ginsenosidimutans]
MTRINLNNKTNHSLITSKIKHRDLAIAIALSSASLFLVPAVAKADTTTTTSTTEPATTTVAPSSSTTSTSTATATTTPTTDTSSTTTPVTTATTTPTSTDSGSTDPVATSPTPIPAGTSTTTTATAPATGTTTSTTPPATTVPTGTTTTTTVTTPTATDYLIYACPVDQAGNQLGDPVAIGSGAANTTSSVTWTPAMLSSLESELPAGSTYTLWDPSAVTGTQQVAVGTADVTIPVKFALKTVTTTYTFVDETTGKTIYTTTNTWDLSSPAGQASFEANGLRPPMDLYSYTGMTTDDLSTDPQTSPDALPYFGADGKIFDNGYYVLDLAKSGNVTPLDYTAWPSTGTINKTFYYTEATEPSVTFEAVDSSGKVLKVFSTTPVSAALPSMQATAAEYVPTASAVELPGYTLTGLTVTGADSESGIPDKTLSYTGSDTDYATFLSSTEGTGTYDVRQLLNDYDQACVKYIYTPNTVKLMVQPVDSTGAPIGDPIEAGSGIVGESATVTAPTLDGYTPSAVTESLTVAPDQGVIKLTYAKASSSTGTGSTTGSGSSTGTTTPPSGSSTGSSSTTGSSSPSGTSSTGSTSAATTPAKPTSSAPAPTRESYKAMVKSGALKRTAKPSQLSASGVLAGTPTRASRFPQTSNNTGNILSAIGIGLIGILGLCYKKIKSWI